jgi:hypothetical protein
MDSLPVELWYLIVSFLPFDDKHLLRQVCQRLRGCVNPRILTFGDLEGQEVVGIYHTEVSKKLIAPTQRELPIFEGKRRNYCDSWAELFLLIRDDKVHGESVLNLRVVALISDNDDKCMSYWFDHWRVRELPSSSITITPGFKYIGERIDKIIVAKEELLQDSIVESEGSDGIIDYIVELQLRTKRIRLGINWTDCDYPGTIWDVI